MTINATGLLAQNVSFSYNRSEPILQNLNFALSPGQLMLVCGNNGVGKSTLINLLAGLLKQNSGQIFLTGAENNLRRESALVPQNIEHWLLAETGREDIFLGIEAEAPQVRAHFQEINKTWQLDAFLDKPVEILSLGQKKRLALAAALLKKSKLLLLDEPMAGLDWPGQKSMLADLAKIKAERQSVMVVVSHDPGVLASLTDLYLFLNPGGQYQLNPSPPNVEDFNIRPF